mgnify:CR=1 FL=1
MFIYCYQDSDKCYVCGQADCPVETKWGLVDAQGNPIADSEFYGFDMDTKNNVELIQHVSQINILLVKLPRLNPEQPKRPIGFNAEK